MYLYLFVIYLYLSSIEMCPLLGHRMPGTMTGKCFTQLYNNVFKNIFVMTKYSMIKS